jgi:hypothetical protein
MYSEFGWSGAEDEPSFPGVGESEPENVAEKRSRRIGIVGVDE